MCRHFTRFPPASAFAYNLPVECSLCQGLLFTRAGALSSLFLSVHSDRTPGMPRELNSHMFQQEPDDKGQRGLHEPDRGVHQLCVCSRCSGQLELAGHPGRCSTCSLPYPTVGGIPVLLSDAEGYLESCRGQLAQLRKHVHEVASGIRDELSAGDLLPTTEQRCEELAVSIGAQFEELLEFMGEALGEIAPAGSPEAADHPEYATLEHLPLLFRDWGGGAQGERESAKAFKAVEDLLGGAPLGRTLVLGGGACRLPYDLCQAFPEAELLVVDWDPILMSVARRVVDGGVVQFREMNVETWDLDRVQRSWELRARNGPVDPERFFLLIADGTAPPLPPGSFDTVLTPWFIDQGPSDLRDFLPTIHQLLRPGGRWLNLGPLRYKRDTPFSLRFTRQEIFQLLSRLGFEVLQWKANSTPYLVSDLNGRGTMEWVLAFSAERGETKSRDAVPGTHSRVSDSPPSQPVPSPSPTEPLLPPDWLIFSHLPIPEITEPPPRTHAAPLLALIARSIDGTRCIRDLAEIVGTHSGRSGLTPEQLRQAVRQALVLIHPGTKKP